MRRLLIWLAFLAVVGAAGFWFLTTPSVNTTALTHQGDPADGALVFAAGGCSSCHAAKGAKGDDKLVLTGGLELKTEFGTFVVPNISPHPIAGIGGWEPEDFVTAMQHGTSPDGRHYFPSFPYTSYARMPVNDVLDLFAYLKTLPQTDQTNPDHDMAFPFSFRRGIGMWKLVNMSAAPVLPVSDDPQIARGQLLVEGAGHCGECHTPRDFGGGLKTDRWLAGGPNPDGPGKIPNITPHESGLGGWSAQDIAYYLETGFTPDFDSAGGQMASVVENMALLPPEDRAAIAAYLKAVPALAGSP